MNRKVVLAINSAWNVANFRGGLVRGLQADGWEVVTMAPRDDHVPRVEALGCHFVELPMQGSGTNPWHDILLYRRFKAALAVERPAAFLGFTIKPNIYGSLAAQSLDIPVINNIAGLGTTFIRLNWLTPVVHILYRQALKRSRRVLFQNEDDRTHFIRAGLVGQASTQRVPGSGVDLKAFVAVPLPRHGAVRTTRFLFIGRLLRDKGVLELAVAARELRARGANVEVQLLGFLDVDNPSAVSRTDVDGWQAEGVLAYLGSTDDVRPHIAAADCVVLPSYREGVPRVLLEAAAMGRPLIASDAPGCRDVIDDGVNGFLVQARDARDLAQRMLQFAELGTAQREVMARASRRKVEREFDEQLVVDAYRDLMRDLNRGTPLPSAHQPTR